MIRAITAFAAVIALTACTSSAETDTPDWFNQRQAELDAQGTPSLRGIPRATTARTNAGYWARVERDMAAAEAAVRAHPRSAAPAAEEQTPEAIEAAARAAIEATASKY